VPRITVAFMVALAVTVARSGGAPAAGLEAAVESVCACEGAVLVELPILVALPETEIDTDVFVVLEGETIVT